MIITLIGADFSASNIGTLSTWRIARSLGAGATYEGVTSVDKGAAFTGTVIIADGYELGTAGVTVTMGGVVLSGAHSISGNVITINISSVTGNVFIAVPTVNTNTGEEDGGESEEPEVTETIWYVDYRNQADAFTVEVNISGRGWAYQTSSDAYKAYVGQPVNTIGFFTTKTEGQMVTLWVGPEQGTVAEGNYLGTYTSTSSDSSEKHFTTITFPAITLNEGEVLAAFAQENNDIHFYYAGKSSIVDANGNSTGGFWSRAPQVYGSGTSWTNAGDMYLGWSIGYVVS